MTDWHGWQKGDVSLHVGPLPGRKSVALYLHAGTVVTALAYFRDEGAAATCLRWLDGDLDAASVVAGAVKDHR